MKLVTKTGTVLSFIACAMIIFGGCATIFNGSTESVAISSEPSGAKVYINGVYMGEAPVQIQLKTNKSYTVEFRKDGFGSRTVLINNSVGIGWVILDAIFGLIPIVVDAATGSWYGFDNDFITAHLEAVK